MQIRQRLANASTTKFRKRKKSFVVGAIKRLTIAVLVNGVTAQNDAGEPVFEAHGDEELAAMRELISATVGFDETRAT